MRSGRQDQELSHDRSFDMAVQRQLALTRPPLRRITTTLELVGLSRLEPAEVEALRSVAGRFRRAERRLEIRADSPRVKRQLLEAGMGAIVLRRREVAAMAAVGTPV